MTELEGAGPLPPLYKKVVVNNFTALESEESARRGWDMAHSGIGAFGTGMAMVANCSRVI